MKRLVKGAVRWGLHHAGGLSWYRYRHSGALRILCYHRFSRHERDLAPDWEEQCRLMRERYYPVSLADAVRTFADGRELPPHAVVATVDDGYRDFYVSGWPAARKYGIPMTVFLTTGFLDGECWMWWDRVQYAALHTKLPTLDWEFRSGRRFVRPLTDTPAERRAAAHELCDAATHESDTERRRLANEIDAALGVDMPERPPAVNEPLRWDEVREMAAAGVDFGGHTHTHPILTALPEAEIAEEVVRCRSRIETELDRDIPHFCYPNGDFDERVLRQVSNAGFRAATTVERGFNRPPAHPLLLKRIVVEPDFPFFYFSEQLAGFRIGA